MPFINDEDLQRHTRRIQNMIRRGDHEIDILSYQRDIVINMVSRLANAGVEVPAAELREQAQKLLQFVKLGG